MAFCAFLATQVAQDIFHSHANKTTSTQDKKAYYQNQFKKLKYVLNGKTMSLAESDKEIVIINFWASWCVPCLKEFPSLNKLNKLYDGRILTLGINTDEEEPEKMVRKITKKYNLNFSSIIDKNSKYTEKFLVNNIPFSLTFVNGKLVHYSEETHDFLSQDYLAKIKAVLKK